MVEVERMEGGGPRDGEWACKLPALSLGQERHFAGREAEAGRGAATRARAESRRAKGLRRSTTWAPQSSAERATVARDPKTHMNTAFEEAQQQATRKKAARAREHGLVSNVVPDVPKNTRETTALL